MHYARHSVSKFSENAEVIAHPKSTSNLPTVIYRGTVTAAAVYAETYFDRGEAVRDWCELIELVVNGNTVEMWEQR